MFFIMRVDIPFAKKYGKSTPKKRRSVKMTQIESFKDLTKARDFISGTNLIIEYGKTEIKRINREIYNAATGK